MFTISQLEDSQDAKKKKQEASYKMLKDFFDYMYESVQILMEYDHLIAHDSTDCYKNYTYGCFFRKYGATLLGVSSFLSISIWLFVRKVQNTVKVA